LPSAKFEGNRQKKEKRKKGSFAESALGRSTKTPTDIKKGGQKESGTLKRNGNDCKKKGKVVGRSQKDQTLRKKRRRKDEVRDLGQGGELT